MPARRFFPFAFAIALLPVAAARAEEQIDYLRHIKPILKRHCSECHSAKKPRGGLRLDLAKHLLAGGDNGKVIVPGRAAKSLLFKMVKRTGGKAPKMPRNRTPLSKQEITLLQAWIDQGAKAPTDEKVALHWSFVPPMRSALPDVKNRKWVRNPIDYFILARLEKEGIEPSPQAGKATLIRRLYLDLLGLPPSIAQVDAFLKDNRPDAYAKLVDKVLSSPHYGERWGRHWLDVARYADSNGFTIDSPREIWLYRDWVINALNKDIPFDQFVIEQVAGDMLPGATRQQKIATGFHRNTLINQEGGTDQEQFRVDAVADRVNTTGVVFLGLTLGCARCHDHKYDPISQKEYFQLFAFLNNQSEPTVSLATPELAKKRKSMLAQIAELEKKQDAPLKTFVTKLPKKEQDKIKDNISMILRLRPDQRTNSQKRSLEKFFAKKDAGLKKSFDDINLLKRKLPKFPTTMVLQELSKPRATHVHIKGDFTRKGDRVFPATPAVLHGLGAKPQAGKNVNRLKMARWLVDRKNPLTARVTVNRIWQRYFAAGIVQTENDFGTQGSLPAHPRLLDWLAVEFMDSGWKLKQMHKLIVTSATYRQSSKARGDVAKNDPGNKLLSRQNRFRLDAEVVRDNALAVSALLSRKMGGPSVRPPQPKGVYAFTQVKRQWNTATGADRFRRGMYTFLQRSLPYPMLKTFDAPDGNSSCTRRVRSNTPLQALTLLNDKAFMEIAHGLAKRILKEGPHGNGQRLNFAFRLCMAREPDSIEAALLGRYLEQQLEGFGKSAKDSQELLRYCRVDPKTETMNVTERAAWTSMARVLLNLDEFITRE